MNRGGFGGGKAMLADPRTQKNPNNSQKAKKLDKKTRRAVLLRLGKYLFKHKLILLVAFILMISSNVLALFGPKLSGLAINAIEPGAGQVDIPTAKHIARARTRDRSNLSSFRVRTDTIFIS